MSGVSQGDGSAASTPSRSPTRIRVLHALVRAHPSPTREPERGGPVRRARCGEARRVSVPGAAARPLPGRVQRRLVGRLAAGAALVHDHSRRPAVHHAGVPDQVAYPPARAGRHQGLGPRIAGGGGECEAFRAEGVQVLGDLHASIVPEPLQTPCGCAERPRWGPRTSRENQPSAQACTSTDTTSARWTNQAGPPASAPAIELPRRKANTVGAARKNSQTPANEASSWDTNSVSTATNTATATTRPR